MTDTLPAASYADGRVSVSLPDGVSFSFPIVGNWRLEEATLDQLNNMEVDDEMQPAYCAERVTPCAWLLDMIEYPHPPAKDLPMRRKAGATRP